MLDELHSSDHLMTRQLLPLHALRAFESAARNLSFTKAAQELHVTPSAISHQVRALEEILGRPLFRRFNRRLALTETGQAYLPALRDAFDQMDEATQRLRHDDGPGQIKVSTLQSFGAKWLLPRLPRFYEREPNIEVMISTSSRVVDFTQDDIDLAIRYGRGDYPGLHTVHLMGDVNFPACSPRLLRGRHALKTPDDLCHHTLLHDSNVNDEEKPARVRDEPIGWRTWGRIAGVHGVDFRRGPGYSDSSMVIQAAIAGQGVALARRSLVLDDLRAGVLVRPFGPALPSHFSYYLVCPRMSADRLKIRAFCEWLLSEIANDTGDDLWNRLAT
jgi:LysR family glycine cleavage system transcriptional activator